MQTLEIYRQGQGTASDDLVAQHVSLVVRIGHHVAARLPEHVSREDLIQCGMLRLVEAAADYDPTRDTSFATYAGIRIRGAMMDEIRANSWAPRSVHRRARDIAAAMRPLREELGRDARPSEIAERLGITTEEYFRTLDAVSRGNLLSLDELMSRDNGASAEPSAGGDEPAERLSREQLTRRLAQAIEGLSEREQHVVSMYYVDELNLREIGAVLGVTESRVSQIHTQLLLRLRARMADD